MKLTDRKKFILLIVVSFFGGHYLFDDKFNFYSEMITFISIIIGFMVTSLSILFNSPLKQTLLERHNKAYKTELHRLKSFYKSALRFKIVSILILFVIPNDAHYSFVVGNYEITLGKYLIVLPILGGTVFWFYKVFDDLLEIFTYPTNH